MGTEAELFVALSFTVAVKNLNRTLAHPMTNGCKMNPTEWTNHIFGRLAPQWQGAPIEFPQRCILHICVEKDIRITISEPTKTTFTKIRQK